MKIKEEKNPYNTKSWSRMSAINKRKSIAWDVLFQMKLKNVKAGTGYCSIESISNRKDTKKHIEDVISSERSCYSCAMGTLMTVEILNRNSFKGAWKDVHIIKRFDGIFSEFQLRLIEAAYEKASMYSANMLRDKIGNVLPITKKAIRFGYKYVYSEQRLKGIMKNIIKDEKGLFLGVDIKTK